MPRQLILMFRTLLGREWSVLWTPSDLLRQLLTDHTTAERLLDLVCDPI